MSVLQYKSYGDKFQAFWAKGTTQEQMFIEEAVQEGINPQTIYDYLSQNYLDQAKKPKNDDAVIMVSPQNGDDGNDGLSAGSAKKTLAAAQTALPVGGGTVKVVGDGTFLLSEFELSKSNTTFEGTGYNCVIQSSTSKANGMIALLKSNIVIRGFRFVGGGEGNQPINVANPVLADFANSGCGIIFAGCINCYIEHCDFEDWGGLTATGDEDGVAGIWFTMGTNKCKVFKCNFVNCGRIGWCEDNYFTEGAGPGGSDNRVLFCEASSCRFGYAAENAVSGNGLIIMGNYAYDCLQSGYDINGCFGSTITGNYAIRCGLQDSNSGITCYNGSVHCSFLGNHCYENRGNGLRVFASRYNTIVGNHCDWNYRHGFYGANTANNNLWAFNSARQNSQETDNTYDNYNLEDNSDNCSFIGNISLRKTDELKQPRYGLNIASVTCNDTEVWANNLTDSGKTGEFNNAGTATISIRRLSSGLIGADGAFASQRSLGTSAALIAKVVAAAVDNFAVRADGQLRWSDGANPVDTILERDLAGNRLKMGAGDSFRLDGTWNGGRFFLGDYQLWVDGTGLLRIKNGTPSSDTDGTIVGTQA